MGSIERMQAKGVIPLSASYKAWGSVAERSKALGLGSSPLRAWVRIPPLSLFFCFYFKLKLNFYYFFVFILNEIVHFYFFSHAFFSCFV